MEKLVDEELKEMKGSFVISLMRNNKEIRNDRAAAIAEDAELLFKRKVEDVGTQLKRLKRDRDNMLDLAGTDKTKIINPSDFHADQFVAKDLQIGLAIRDCEIELKILTDRYNELFKSEEVK
jgi:hypothetical protein